MSWLDRVVSYASYLAHGHLPTETEVDTSARQFHAWREKVTSSYSSSLAHGHLPTETKMTTRDRQFREECRADAIDYARGVERGRDAVSPMRFEADLILDYLFCRFSSPQLQDEPRPMEHLLGRLSSQRLIRTGFSPVASMENGALMSAPPDPECGRTMSCESPPAPAPSDTNPPPSSLRIHEISPERIEAMRRILDEMRGRERH